MNELFKYIQKLPPSSAIVILILGIILMAISKWDSIMKLIKLAFGKSGSKKRTCGDCVLILFGIREKYEYQIRIIDINVLRQQMKFSEQKIQELVFFLSQSFIDDIKLMCKDGDYEIRVREIALYCEALKNSVLSIKEELRRSFKENGFQELSENEFTHYVKDKTKLMITMVRSYLNQHYIDNDSTIVHLRERFQNMDNTNMHKFEDWCFDVFNNAKDLVKDAKKSKEEINSKLISEINSFVLEGTKPLNC